MHFFLYMLFHNTCFKNKKSGYEVRRSVGELDRVGMILLILYYLYCLTLRLLYLIFKIWKQYQ